MFIELLQNSVTNLVPYWTVNLLQFLGIGNEYNALISLIFNQVVKDVSYVGEEIYIGLIITFFIGLLFYKFNFFGHKKTYNFV